MPECPQCRQFIRDSVYARVVECPFCKLPLKAHGHPLMTLHHAKGAAPLCVSCLYDADDTCTLPQRPEARTCTLYQNRAQLEAVNPLHRQQISLSQRLRWIWQQYGTWLGLAGLVIVSILIAYWRSR